MNARAEFEVEDAGLPWSQEQEQAVLGSLLLDVSAWDRVGDILTAGDFFEARHREIFQAIAGLVAASKPVDVITVHGQIVAAGNAADVDPLYLVQLTQCVAGIRGARAYAERVAELARHRALIAAADAAGALARGSTDASETIDTITASFIALMQRGNRREPQTIQDLAVAWIDRLNDLANGQIVPGVPTGLPNLDAALNGGLREGGLYILAARPSVGKSSLSQAILTHAAMYNDAPGLFLSLEMPSQDVMDRAVSNIGRVTYDDLLRGQLTDQQWSDTSEAIEKLRTLRLQIDDEQALTLAAIRAKAMAVKRRQGLRILVLDYLQLCASTGRHQNRNSEIEEISRGLKALAKELSISVIALSQLNREVEKRANPEPVMSDLRDSGAIEQDADVVMFLWRCREFSESQVMGLTLAKNRQGKAGTRLALEFRGQYQRWDMSHADVTPPSKRAASKHDGGFD